jgi:hypothetical protein
MNKKRYFSTAQKVNCARSHWCVNVIYGRQTRWSIGRQENHAFNFVECAFPVFAEGGQLSGRDGFVRNSKFKILSKVLPVFFTVTTA